MAINQKPEIHNLVICSNVFIRKDGKWLLLKRSEKKKFAPNYIHPFGGKVDLDENPYEAAIREVREEVGIKVKNLKLEAIINELKPDKNSQENWLIFHFSADYDSGEVIKTDEGEAVLLTTEEVKNSKLFPSVKSIIDSILDEDIGTVFTSNSYEEHESAMTETSKNFCVFKQI